MRAFLFRIHPRWKRQVAYRLALAGLAVAYGDESEGLWQGPMPTAFRLEDNNLVVTLADGQVPLEARDTDTSYHYEVRYRMYFILTIPKMRETRVNMSSHRSCVINSTNAVFGDRSAVPLTRLKSASVKATARRRAGRERRSCRWRTVTSP